MPAKKRDHEKPLEKAMALYSTLSQAEREKVPQILRVWLRYRSEKYFGDDRTRPGGRKSS